MNHLFFSLIPVFVLAACGPLTKAEAGGDLDFQVDLQNDADVPITLKVYFDLCQIDAVDAVGTAAPHSAFSHKFVGKCEKDSDYDHDEEKVELTSTTGKHNVTLSSGCHQAARCNNDGCITTLDANCQAQPTPRDASFGL